MEKNKNDLINVGAGEATPLPEKRKGVTIRQDSGSQGEGHGLRDTEPASKPLHFPALLGTSSGTQPLALGLVRYQTADLLQAGLAVHAGKQAGSPSGRTLCKAPAAQGLHGYPSRKRDAWWPLCPFSFNLGHRLGEGRSGKETIPIVVILLLENRFLALAFRFLLEVSFPIPGSPRLLPHSGLGCRCPPSFLAAASPSWERGHWRQGPKTLPGSEPGPRQRPGRAFTLPRRKKEFLQGRPRTLCPGLPGRVRGRGAGPCIF